MKYYNMKMKMSPREYGEMKNLDSVLRTNFTSLRNNINQEQNELISDIDSEYTNYGIREVKQNQFFTSFD